MAISTKRIRKLFQRRNLESSDVVSKPVGDEYWHGIELKEPDCDITFENKCSHTWRNPCFIRQHNLGYLRDQIFIPTKCREKNVPNFKTLKIWRRQFRWITAGTNNGIRVYSWLSRVPGANTFSPWVLDAKPFPCVEGKQSRWTEPFDRSFVLEHWTFVLLTQDRIHSY